MRRNAASGVTSGPATSSRAECVYDKNAGSGPQEGMQLFKSAAALRREHLDRTMSREKERPSSSRRTGKKSGRESKLAAKASIQPPQKKVEERTADLETISLRDLDKSKDQLTMKETEFDELQERKKEVNDRLLREKEELKRQQELKR